ncbi:UNKNOWN [Stylonychia lemnae]|uniref:Uncharacterized protein n=1 Tax=Stylonychia lemnae TaxID=5949 RepID=A0A078AYE0_STYLE|nr:UNKNOWN [Stylonychia lemnae]|eukprot:CDW87151.1 UNKNOWN [Stylonychia lemnae]
MGQGCCANREYPVEDGAILPQEKRRKFKYELSTAVNKMKLHKEVLSQQQVLDFDSYKSIMALINAYVTDLTDKKNELDFEKRIELLQKGDTEEYDKMIFEICLYQVRVQESLMTLAKDSLEIHDEAVIQNSHETYESRQQLFDHMNEEVRKRQDKRLVSQRSKKTGELTIDAQNEAYNFYSEKLSYANQQVIDNPDTVNSDKHINYIEEQSLKLEDQIYLKYGLSFHEFRIILERKKEDSETPIAKP